VSWLEHHAIGALLTPPGSLILLIAAGLLLGARHPRTGRTLAWIALIILYLLSTPLVSIALLQWWEPSAALDTDTAPAAQAIVVLGGGTYFRAPEYGGDTVNKRTLVRLRYAARLQRRTHLPLLVAGGAPQGNTRPEAIMMKAVLEQDFNVPVAWVEDQSKTTLENATRSYAILHAANIDTIYLVTSARHMPRATLAFERVGFHVIPAPTQFTTHYHTTLLSVLPNARALRNSASLAWETIGFAWYRLQFFLSDHQSKS
jgi:uncharacterized SAM-binding protein YcdF (DUF218 family)